MKQITRPSRESLKRMTKKILFMEQKNRLTDLKQLSHVLRSGAFTLSSFFVHSRIQDPRAKNLWPPREPRHSDLLCVHDHMCHWTPRNHPGARSFSWSKGETQSNPVWLDDWTSPLGWFTCWLASSRKSIHRLPIAKRKKEKEREREAESRHVSTTVFKRRSIRIDGDRDRFPSCNLERSIIHDRSHVSRLDPPGWMGGARSISGSRWSVGWSRSTEAEATSGSTCTRFDYRSRFEDRLIASSVDEELVAESGAAACLQLTTCRLPPGIPAVISNLVRLSLQENVIVKSDTSSSIVFVFFF